MRILEGWARSAAHFGVGASYQRQLDANRLPNYPPFSMVLFAATAHVFDSLRPSDDADAVLPELVIKLPAIAADVAMMVGLFIFGSSGSGVGRVTE